MQVRSNTVNVLHYAKFAHIAQSTQCVCVCVRIQMRDGLMGKTFQVPIGPGADGTM